MIKDGDMMVRFYTAMCIFGFVLPYAALIAWLLDERTTGPGDFARDVFANGLSTMGWVDVIITASVVITFVRHESRRLKMGSVTAPIVGTCLVGPSFGLPLFLLMREKFQTSAEASVQHHG